MSVNEWMSVLVNAVTVVAWMTGIGITLAAVAKGRNMRDEMGVSIKVYLTLAVVTEVLYTLGALMILAAMGINVTQHLARLEFQSAYDIVSRFDVTTIELVGIVGWVGFVINRGVSYLSPGYLLIAGKDKLHRYFRVSAWTEISLETLITLLLFVTLKLG